MLIQALPYCLLILFVFAAFASSLGGFFICDDLLHQSYLWRAFNGEPGLLISPFYSPWLKDDSFFSFYRPLAELSFAFDYALFGTHAFGYHLTSLLWHCTNVCLLFILVRTLTEVPAFYIAGEKERRLLAFFCAAIWAVYPTHCEAISWISARSDLIATTMYFATMILFAKNLTGKNKLPAALVALPMVLGFLTKELTVSLPFTLFSLYFFSCKSPGPRAWLASLKEAAAKTAPYFAVMVIYLIVRGLALGTFVGGYVGSVGAALNQSFVYRWFYSPSFFKIFHPFNDQLIPAADPLRLGLRIIWGLCGAMCLIWAKIGGAIAGKYKLMLFAFAWLFFSLAPNAQIWSFSETMAGGRIAYLPTVPVVLLIVLAVYPMGAWSLPGRTTFSLKLAGFATLSALIILGTITSNINDRAWLLASDMVRSVRGQLSALTDQLKDGQQLAVLNLPTNVKGAYAFTSPGMVETLLRNPFRPGNDSSRVAVLDPEPCSYPRVNLSDVRAAASIKNKDKLLFYFWDNDTGRLRQAGEDSFLVTDDATPVGGDADRRGAPLPALTGRLDLHKNEESAETFGFALDPQINPCRYEYARLTLTLSPRAKIERLPEMKGANILDFIWRDCPEDDLGDKDSLTAKLIKLPAPGGKETYLINLGANKRWLLSRAVNYMQFYLVGLKDEGSTLQLELLGGEDQHPWLEARVNGEKDSDKLLSFKHIARTENQTLTLAYDASGMAGAKAIKIELLPPYHYFEHYARLLTAPQFLSRDLRLFDMSSVKGSLSLGAKEFPRPGIYQIRAGAIGAAGQLLGDFSEPITISVSD